MKTTFTRTFSFWKRTGKKGSKKLKLKGQCARQQEKSKKEKIPRQMESARIVRPTERSEKFFPKRARKNSGKRSKEEPKNLMHSASTRINRYRRFLRNFLTKEPSEPTVCVRDSEIAEFQSEDEEKHQDAASLNKTKIARTVWGRFPRRPKISPD